MWFKEDPPALAFEPSLTVLLERRRPDCVPEVIAAEGPRLLTRDSGPSLREAHDRGEQAPAWPEVLASATPSASSTSRPTSTWRSRPERPTRGRRGCPPSTGSWPATARWPRSCAKPPRRSTRRSRSRSSTRRPTTATSSSGTGRQASSTGPRRPSRIRLPARTSRWRSAAERAGYPPGSPEVERLRDAYLEPFTTLAPLAELRKTFAHGHALTALLRAATWDRIVSPLPPAARGEHAERVAAWLGILGELAAGKRQIGG